MFNAHFNVYCTNIHKVIYMNTVNYTAKKAQKMARTTVGLPVWVKLGHMVYQIEANGISDSK